MTTEDAGTPRQEAAWGRTWALIKADLRRRLLLEGRPVNWVNALRIALLPGVVCVVSYRIITMLHLRGYRALSQILQDLQHLYTGVEIHSGSIIGPGFVLGDRPGGGISEHVTIGTCCTVLGGATITLNADGIDLSKGRILIGDHCVIGVGARIIGALTLGDATQVKPNAVVLMSSPMEGGILSGIPAIRRAIMPMADVVRWNPLRPNLMMPASGSLPVGSGLQGRFG